MAETPRYLGLAPLKNEGSGEPLDLDKFRFRWKDRVAEEMRKQNDDRALVWRAGDAERLNRFLRPYSDEACEPWCVWTESRVYFPVVYDGRYSVGSAPRNPTTGGAGPFGGGW